MLNRLSFTVRRIHLRVPQICFIALALVISLGAIPFHPPRIAPKNPALTSASASATTATADWHSLPNLGLDNVVYAIVAMGDDLYIGGDFDQTGDGSLTNLGGIVRYNLTTRTWHALPKQGLNADVRALAVVGDDLFAGGNFTATGDSSLTNLGYLARYDSATETWNALPKQGVNSVVWALAATGSDLYIGGNYTQTGDASMTNLGRIVRYDTTGDAFHALPNQGLSWYVFELKVSGDDLYVGGLFTQTGDGSLSNLGHLIRYDTTNMTWHHFPNQGLNDGVYALLMSGSNLYIGGNFTQTGDGTNNLSHITRYDTATNTWHSFPHQGLDGIVLTLVMIDANLYMGGQFTQTGDGTLSDLGYIGRYNIQDTTWYAMPSQGFNSWTNALVAVDGDLYAGGYFNMTGDFSIALNRIVRYGEDYRVYLPMIVKQ